MCVGGSWHTAQQRVLLSYALAGILFVSANLTIWDGPYPTFKHKLFVAEFCYLNWIFFKKNVWPGIVKPLHHNYIQCVCFHKLHFSNDCSRLGRQFVLFLNKCTHFLLGSVSFWGIKHSICFILQKLGLAINNSPGWTALRQGLLQTPLFCSKCASVSCFLFHPMGLSPFQGI